jgi:hypothetical protein
MTAMVGEGAYLALSCCLQRRRKKSDRKADQVDPSCFATRARATVDVARRHGHTRGHVTFFPRNRIAFACAF